VFRPRGVDVGGDAGHFAPPRMQVLETKKLISLPAQWVGRPRKTTPLNQADESAP